MAVNKGRQLNFLGMFMFFLGNPFHLINGFPCKPLWDGLQFANQGMLNPNYYWFKIRNSMKTGIVAIRKLGL